MPTHHETQQLPYTTDQLFAMVADVAAYPDFLPWCVGARILERSEAELTAQLLIGYKNIRETYTSRVLLSPPARVHAPCEIRVEQVKGPFEHLSNHWQFIPDGEYTTISFDLDFNFRSKMLDGLLGGFFHKATQRMVSAFKDRADVLYGARGRL